MSKSSSIKRNIILLFVFVVSVALIAADMTIVSAQGNDNQTRGGQMTSNGNMSGNMSNMNTGNRGGRRRRRRGGGATATTNSSSTVSGGDASGNMSTTMQGNDNSGGMLNMNTGTTTSTGRRRRRRRGGVATATTGVMTTTTPVADSVQTDLSGTYMGTLSCGSIPASGEGTLTITGNQYTFAPTGGSASINGRIVAVTTRGYTAVAMQYGESVAPPPGQPSTPPVIVSLRARKYGDNLTLTGIQGSPLRDCAFNAGRPMRTGRRRRGRM